MYPSTHDTSPSCLLQENLAHCAKQGHLVECRMATNRPFANQGQTLKTARGSRKLREVANLLSVSVGTYQHWEYGDNSPKLWGKIKKQLGVDAAKLYTGVESLDGPGALDTDAVLALLDAAERNLKALRMLCVNHAADARLKELGIRDPRKKKTTA
jgi:hypothetical protein